MAVGHQIIFLFLAIVTFRSCLNIDPEPQFADVIHNVTVLAGRDVTLSCVVDSLGKYKVAWIKMEPYEVLTIKYHVINGDPRFSVTATKDFRTWSLHIRNVSVFDSSPYMCQINTSPMKELVGFIRVIDPGLLPKDPEPQFASLISNRTVLAGSNVTFSCVVNSLGKYKVAWIRKDPYEVLSIKYHLIIRDPRFSVTATKDFRTWSLQILNVSVFDSGPYMCQIDTSPMKDRVVILQVVALPIIRVSNQLVGAAIGEDVTLDCNLESKPKSLTYWTRNGSEIRIKSNTKYNSTSIDMGIYRVQMRLIIKNLRPDDFGSYICFAQNVLGDTEGTITLYEIPKPDTSTYPSRGSIASSSAEDITKPHSYTNASRDDLATNTVESYKQDLANEDLEKRNSSLPVRKVSGSKKGDEQGEWMWATVSTIFLLLLSCLENDGQ